MTVTDYRIKYKVITASNHLIKQCQRVERRSYSNDDVFYNNSLIFVVIKERSNCYSTFQLFCESPISKGRQDTVKFSSPKILTDPCSPFYIQLAMCPQSCFLKRKASLPTDTEKWKMGKAHYITVLYYSYNLFQVFTKNSLVNIYFSWRVSAGNCRSNLEDSRWCSPYHRHALDY